MTSTASPFARFSDDLADTVAATSPSIVEVKSHRSLASGFIWRDGMVVTPDETLAEEGGITVETADGAVLAATLIGRDPATDVALLRVAGMTSPPLPASIPVRAGAFTLVVAAADSAPLVAVGGVAVAGPGWQSMRGGVIDARIELDLCLRRRAEGGLAVSVIGAPFGMAVRGPRGRTLVIPMATINRIAGLLLDHGRVPIAYLGVGFQDVSLDDGERGAMVMTVDRSGPAAAAGVKQGDIVVAWAGERIAHVGALLHKLRATAVGTPVSVGLRRGGAATEVTVTVGDRPQR